MEIVSNKSQSSLLKSPEKLNQGENFAEEIISNSNAQETKGHKYTLREFKQDVAVVFTVAALLSIGTYIAWRLDGCPPIQGQVKQLPPKSLLSN